LQITDGIRSRAEGPRERAKAEVDKVGSAGELEDRESNVRGLQQSREPNHRGCRSGGAPGANANRRQRCRSRTGAQRVANDQRCVRSRGDDQDDGDGKPGQKPAVERKRHRRLENLEHIVAQDGHPRSALLDAVHLDLGPTHHEVGVDR
jgi:hypothetical protein